MQNKRVDVKKEIRNASDQLTFEFSVIESVKYDEITKSVIVHFGIEGVGRKITGLDEIFQDFKRSNEVVSLEWDIWSGYIVCAKTEQAESLAKEIASFVDENYCS